MKPCIQIKCPPMEEIQLHQARDYFWMQTESGPVAIFFEERTPLTDYTPPWERL